MNKTTISAFLILVSIFSISCDGDDTENTPLFDARRISQFDINSDFSEDPLYTFRYSYNQQEDIDSINFEIQGLVRSSFKYVYNSNFRLEKVELTTYGFDGSQRLSTIYGYEYEVQESRPARITISSASSPDVIFRYLRFEYAQTDLVRLEWYESDFTTGTDRLISSTDYEYFQERLLSLNNIPTPTVNTINPFFYNERVVAM